MQHKSWIVPGFDCERGPCPAKGCPGFGDPRRPGGGHGAHGDEWYYAVIADDGLTALSLTVSTPDLPLTVPRPLPSVWDEGAFGTDLSLHVAWKTRTERGHECSLVIGGRCSTPFSTALGAHEFFAEHGDRARFEQPGSFWVVLERRCAELSAKAYTERIDTN